MFHKSKNEGTGRRKGVVAIEQLEWSGRGEGRMGGCWKGAVKVHLGSGLEFGLEGHV